MNRLPLLLVIAVLEATLISLPLLALGVEGLPWALVVALVLLSALADWLIQGWLPESRQRNALLAVCAVLSLSLALPRGGGLGALLPAAPGFGTFYGVLLLSLFTCWRGSRLNSHDGRSVAHTFRSGVVATIVALLLGSLIIVEEDVGRASALTIQIILAVAAGLLAQALTREEEENEGTARQWGWRWLATLMGAIGLVILLALAVASVVGDGVAALFQRVLAGVALVVLVIFGPLLWLLGTLIQWLLSVLPERRPLQLPPALTGQSPLEQLGRSLVPIGVPEWLERSIVGVVALLPLALIALLIFFVRRRRRPEREQEERESLLSLQVLGADLRALLANLRRPFSQGEEGLRGVLATLIANDPATRVRRAYIRLLLTLEARTLPRPAPATPAEFAPQAQHNLPAAETSIGKLTRAYERARYGQANTSDAEEAERAWSAIQASDAK